MGKTKKNNPKAVKAVTEDRKKGLKRAPEAEAKAVPLSKKSKKNKPIPPQKQQKKKIKRPPQKLEESDDPSEDEEMEALSEEDNSEEDVEVPASKPKKQGKMVQKTSDDEDEAEDIDEGSESGDEDGSDDDDDIADEDDDENGEVAEPPSKNGSAVKQDGPNKTIFVKNLPFDLEEDTVKDFFKKAGEVAEIRLKKGFGHVEFTTEGAVQKALKFSGQSLGGRNIVCEVARGSGRDEPNGAKRGGETGGGKTIFVKGFDKSQEEEEIRTSLQNHFSDCGAMGAIRIPTDQESGYIKGFAYIEFNEPSSCAKALQKNGSDLDGQTLVVDSAGERSSRGGRGGGGRGGFGGGRGGGFGGGRGGRGGGRGFGGGRGGGRGRGGGGRGRGGGGRGRR